jgi:integrase
VTTTGYGSLQGGSNEDEWYTDEFCCTSAASPIVAGALACVQGFLKAHGRYQLGPHMAREWLRNTGSRQQDAPNRPTTQRIGNRPDLRELIGAVRYPTEPMVSIVPQVEPQVRKTYTVRAVDPYTRKRWPHPAQRDRGRQAATVRREEIHPLTPEQVKMLLEAASGDRLEALYVLAVHTGLRQGELLGLKWDDIDLAARTLQVRRALITARGGPRLAAPKTKGSRRRVSLTGAAVEALKAHLERQLAQIDRAGSLWQEKGLVFASETGAPLDRRDLTSRRFKPLLERARLPHFRFHDLRHTCATLLLTQNVNPKVVSEMLGHSSIAITLDTYSHVLPNMQDSAARALEKALS